MSAISIGKKERLQDDLRERGFCTFLGRDLHMPGECEGEKDALKRAFASGISDGPLRQRYYARYLVGPGSTSATLDLAPGSASYLSSDYYQSGDFNSEQQRTMRSYAPLPPELWNSRLLRELIFFDLNLILLDDFWTNARRNPVAVGIHLIRMVAREGRPSLPSPSVPHQDGEPFTCMHVISREGVQGGATQVFRNAPVNGVSKPGALLQETILTQLFDTLVVWDKSVFHHVTPLEVNDGRARGTRDVLIIDFTPLEECRFNARGEIGMASGSFHAGLCRAEMACAK